MKRFLARLVDAMSAEAPDETVGALRIELADARRDKADLARQLAEARDELRTAQREIRRLKTRTDELELRAVQRPHRSPAPWREPEPSNTWFPQSSVRAVPIEPGPGGDV